MNFNSEIKNVIEDVYWAIVSHCMHEIHFLSSSCQKNEHVVHPSTINLVKHQPYIMQYSYSLRVFKKIHIVSYSSSSNLYFEPFLKRSSSHPCMLHLAWLLIEQLFEFAHWMWGRLPWAPANDLTNKNAMRTAGSDCKQIAGSDSGVSRQRCGHRMHYSTFMQRVCVEVQWAVNCLAGTSAHTPETPHIYL